MVHVDLKAYALADGATYTQTDAYITYNQDISIGPGATGVTVTASCPVPAVKWTCRPTRTSSRSRCSKVIDGSSMLLDSTDWEHPATKSWTAAPYYTFTNPNLTWSCTSNNTGDNAGSTVVAGSSTPKRTRCAWRPATSCPRRPARSSTFSTVAAVTRSTELTSSSHGRCYRSLLSSPPPGRSVVAADLDHDLLGLDRLLQRPVASAGGATASVTGAGFAAGFSAGTGTSWRRRRSRRRPQSASPPRAGPGCSPPSPSVQSLGHAGELGQRGVHASTERKDQQQTAHWSRSIKTAPLQLGASPERGSPHVFVYHTGHARSWQESTRVHARVLATAARSSSRTSPARWSSSTSTRATTRRAARSRRRSFRDAMPALKKLGATVLGVSKDSIASHCKFRDKYELNFPAAQRSGRQGPRGLRRVGRQGDVRQEDEGHHPLDRPDRRAGKVAHHWPKVSA